jgi:transcriptional regulator
MPRDASDLLHGTLDVLVLKALSLGPLHGYAVSEWIERHGDGELVIVDAALYKALHRLEDAGAIESEWGVSENNRKAKYYSLTPRGRAQLRVETATWRRYASAVGRILEAT